MTENTQTASNANMEAIAPPDGIGADELDRDEREHNARAKAKAKAEADAIMGAVRGEMATYTGAEELARKCAKL